MQLSSRILTALAVLILAVAVVAVRAGSPGTVEAATGTINVLNVGTCYTTDTDVFAVGACDDGDDGEGDNEGYSVAGRNTISKVDTVYATYAIDPVTSGDDPRAIAMNSDVIKISIEDKGRDKRTGVIYPVGTQTLTPENSDVIEKALGDLAAELMEPDDNDPATNEDIVLSSESANFGRGAGETAGAITSSGDAQFRLTGDESTDNPMAPKDDGKVFWFGLGPDGPDDGTDQDFQDLTGTFINLDEDLSTGTKGSVAPWMRVTAEVPTTETAGLTVQYIYYQTSDEEVLVGGKKKADYISYTDTANSDNNVAISPGLEGLEPVFEDDEDNATPSTQDALVVRASGDGDDPWQNLWLKEKSRFSGRYEGFLRLTDSDGDGACDHDDDAATDPQRCNWGLKTRDALGHEKGNAAYLGVESGPITITYKNSNGDNRTVSITIDKQPPTIQIDSPLNETSSKDDSPELLGSFTDGGGAGLREDSFAIYAHNEDDDQTDKTPVWDLQVNDPDAIDPDRGYVCVDADEKLGCDGEDAVAVLRGHYSGYSQTGVNGTFGIISSEDVYLAEDIDPDENDGDEYKAEGAEDFEDGDANGLFDTVVRIDFPPRAEDQGRYNHTIDIQAVVMDIAGNIGFSDSEPSDPTFIHDLGTKKADRDDTLGENGKNKHNVLGWYSRHIYFLDDVDPKFAEPESATGFYLDESGDEMRSSSGAMITFDGKLDATTVGVGTFAVKLDDGTDATVTAVQVKDDKVYLMLEAELAPNATPKVDLASGQSISDLAGNESTSRRLDGIELSDGILPTFTIELSGGSGLHADISGQSASELTKDQMNIAITANEPIQGSPKFAVVCSNLTWGGDYDDDDMIVLNKDNNVAKFASNRTGDFTSQQIGNAAPSESHKADADSDGNNIKDQRTLCPDHTMDPDVENDDKRYFDVAVTSALARPGNTWEYQWSTLSGDQAVEQGKLSVIVWGRDRSSYMRGSDRVYNYSASTDGFTYDTVLKSAWAGDEDGDKGELIPDNGETVFEPRPFVLLDFGDEATKVDVTLFEIDGVDQAADLQALDDNEFVWWPDPLAFGTYKVSVEANDGANNTGEHSYSFTVKQRAPFVLDLLAGWNSISFPANPIDRALHAVFTNAAVDQVIGWNVTEPVSPWRIATRQDGVWTTSDEYATLNDVEARYGYWVHSTGFVTQAVHLAGKGDRSTDGQPNPADIPTDKGWNFVGVVDVDGDQTQDDAGETLRNSNNDPITAAEYLGDYVRAYTWDHVNNTWDVLKKDEGITIGTGVWVYYGDGVAP